MINFWDNVRRQIASTRHLTMILAAIAAFLAWVVTDLLRATFGLTATFRAILEVCGNDWLGRTPFLRLLGAALADGGNRANEGSRADVSRPFMEGRIEAIMHKQHWVRCELLRK